MRRLLLAVLALGLAACTPKRPPVVTPPTPPAQETPEQDVAVRPDLLARPAPGAKLTRSGRPWVPTQCVLCCRTFEPAPGFVEVNGGWPLISAPAMDYLAQAGGCDTFHFRMGPFYATDDTEVEWKDVGGPYIGDGPDFNPAFWSRVYELGRDAARADRMLEVVTIDTWYCKHAASNWGDQRMPWPQADIDACGITMTPVQERHIRKVVRTFRCLGNVIFTVDNEGSEIRGGKRGWYEESWRIIRDEEQQAPCELPDGSKVPMVHMVGTNHPEMGDGPFDFVVTHAAAPLLTPLHGKWTLNNERAGLTPDQEVSYFEQARARGLGWAFWRGDMGNEAFERTLARIKAIVGGGAQEVGCMAPPDEDPEWVGNPGTLPLPSAVGAALEAAKVELGDRRPGWPASAPPEQRFEAMFATLDQLAAGMRRRGVCASRSRDSIFARVPVEGETGPKTWYELHAVASTDGGYTGQPYKGSSWRYPR